MRRNYCRSVISLQEPLPHSLWISLDLHGILAIVWTPAYPVVSACVGHLSCRVYNITSSSLLHGKYLLLLCCLLKVSQYQLALIDTASVHIVKGISQHIHNSLNSHTSTYQIHIVFRFNPHSRCNSSSRCCYRAREHVDPA